MNALINNHPRLLLSIKHFDRQGLRTARARSVCKSTAISIRRQRYINDFDTTVLLHAVFHFRTKQRQRYVAINYRTRAKLQFRVTDMAVAGRATVIGYDDE